MNQHPIETLLKEHAEIMAEVSTLRKAVRELAHRGEGALAETLPIFDQITKMMATKLEFHRQREDQVFFPALEDVIGPYGPTRVMRREHELIHTQGELLRQTLYELNEVQHPAIEAGAEKMRQLVAHGGSAAALRQTGEEIIELLDSHFGKEEHILFPMARNMLDETTMNEIAAQFEAM